jgi:hypothetical protein
MRPSKRVRSSGRHTEDLGGARPAPVLHRPRAKARKVRPVRPGNPLALLLGAAVILAGSGVARVVTLSSSQSPVSFQVLADSYVSSTAPAKNYGTSTRLTASAGSGTARIVYLKIDVSAGAWQQVESGQAARLTLTRDLHHLSGAIVAHSVAGTSWSENTLTWANRPTVGPVISTEGLTGASSSAVLDISKAITGSGVTTVALTTQGTAIQRFSSRESTAGAPAVALSGRVVTAPVPTVPSASPTAGPTTPASSPTAVPTTPATSPAPVGGGRECDRSAKLVPACGVLFGVAPGALTTTPHDQALQQFEQQAGRQMDVYRAYHSNGDLFPNAMELSMAKAQPSLTFMFTWKPDTSKSWAAVASGADDARIATLAAHLRSAYPSKPFFLSIWHEPENDVNEAAGSGMTAVDYHDMYRHVVLQLRADGVANAVTVVNYMGYPEWTKKAWWPSLYPGDDVVDWIAQDTYASAAPSGYLSSDFSGMVSRPTGLDGGFYKWAATQHPDKPQMLGEWGVFEDASNPAGKPDFFDSVQAQLPNFPKLKALLYFDSPKAPKGNTSIDTTAAAESAFRKLASSAVVMNGS